MAISFFDGFEEYMSSGAERFLKNVFSGGGRQPNEQVVTTEMLRAAHAYAEHVDNTMGIDCVEDLDDDFFRVLYMIMQEIALQNAGTVVLTHGKPRAVPPMQTVVAGEPKPKPPVTAEWLVEMEKKINEVDHKLVAEMCRQQLEDLNRSFELLHTIGVDIELTDEPQSGGRRGQMMQGSFFGSMFVVEQPDGPRRRYPKLRVKLIKREKL